ncbi:hypothetical protein Psi01_73060 [Planobispora siamensis]|uniref:Uncharacterized protein n=1 Tax=Planobispora siamensis TaxID=936338 RepID=A0A8J3WRB1_9ACTN|nr:hypothetical protein Psi01_73060 [Planobispora siamensis]
MRDRRPRRAARELAGHVGGMTRAAGAAPHAPALAVRRAPSPTATPPAAPAPIERVRGRGPGGSGRWNRRELSE